MDRYTSIATIKTALDEGRLDDVITLAHDAAASGHQDVADRAMAAQAKLRPPPSPPASSRTGVPGIYQSRMPLFAGTYTVVLEDASHVTFRVHVQAAGAKFAPGEWLLERLVAGDRREYKAVGFVKVPDGRAPEWVKSVIITFKTVRGDARLLQAIQTLVGDPKAAATAYAVTSGCCPRCGDELTNPCSLASNIGPRCAREWDWNYVTDPVEAQRILDARKLQLAAPSTDEQAAEAEAEIRAIEGSQA